MYNQWLSLSEGQSGMHGIGGALANEAAVDVHDGEHDVLLMCTSVCMTCC